MNENKAFPKMKNSDRLGYVATMLCIVYINILYGKFFVAFFLFTFVGSTTAIEVVGKSENENNCYIIKLDNAQYEYYLIGVEDAYLIGDKFEAEVFPMLKIFIEKTPFAYKIILDMFTLFFAFVFYLCVLMVLGVKNKYSSRIYDYHYNNVKA